MSGEEFHRLRTSFLKDVEGTVLEIGFGTGLNLAHYPRGVSHLDVVDPAGFLPDRVAARTAVVPFTVQSHYNMAEALSFDDARFDRVVSSWTLCSLTDPQKALREIRRVLKPNGRFLFLEHGRSRDQRTAAWQDRLNPLQNIIGCGCHLNRQIDELITSSGLKIAVLDRFQMETVPRLGGEMYRGWAMPATGTCSRLA